MSTNETTEIQIEDLDEKVLQILRSAKKPLAIPEIERLLVDQVYTFDVRDTVWRLIGKDLAEFTSKRYVMAKMHPLIILGFDATGHERRERLEAVSVCGGCGKEIECWSQTEEWRLAEDFSKTGRREHYAYGPGAGICDTCRHVFIHDPDEGTKEYLLPRAKGE